MNDEQTAFQKIVSAPGVASRGNTSPYCRVQLRANRSLRLLPAKSRPCGYRSFTNGILLAFTLGLARRRPTHTIAGGCGHLRPSPPSADYFSNVSAEKRARTCELT